MLFKTLPIENLPGVKILIDIIPYSFFYLKIFCTDFFSLGFERFERRQGKKRPSSPKEQDEKEDEDAQEIEIEVGTELINTTFVIENRKAFKEKRNKRESSG